MLVYNIPAAALSGYQDKAIAVRSDDARTLVETFSAVHQEKLVCLQVLSLDCDADPLLHLSDSVPVDLVVNHPETEFSRLYRFAELPHKHPARVTVPAVPGMTKAVKIALALDFTVKLELNQPEPLVVDEILALAEYYLHGPTVRNPVEPFHSLFLSFYSDRPASLWSLQDEDPAVNRYVTDDGQITFSKRLVSLGIPEDQFESFLDQSISMFSRDGEECVACGFFSHCNGYFKLPERGYRCEDAKRLFALLSAAAEEIGQDEERFFELYGRQKSSTQD